MNTTSSAELRLTFSNPRLMVRDDNTERVAADTQMVFTQNGMSVAQSEPFPFVAPIGLLEADNIKWYLESYYIWPVGLFKERAERIERYFPQWGDKLLTAITASPSAQPVFQQWLNASSNHEPVFSLHVQLSDTPESKTAASRLLGFPWELLRYDDQYLLTHNPPVRIRRNLPRLDTPSVTPYDQNQTVLRVLAVSPRPSQAGYIDHRASIKPLVEAVESLGKRVELVRVNPPTFDQLKTELRQAQAAGNPFHVLHFDGHGVFDTKTGRGALCFEHPLDNKKLLPEFVKRIYADDLAALLNEFPLPLVFLEACQTGQSEAEKQEHTDPNASVAAALLQAGVASVIAMSHSVLVETARRFVSAFYQQLAEGQRIGSAVLAGRQALMQSTDRINIAGAGTLQMQDWFVPVLYQREDDPRLFSHALQLPDETEPKWLLGDLPETPKHTFIGRSRDLLKLERLLDRQPYAVIRGMGGIGKTAVAVELARWLVQCRRFERCAFVSVETYTHERAIVDILGKQLVNEKYSVAEYGDDLDAALQPIIQILQTQRTLLVIDNMESLLADVGNTEPVLALADRLIKSAPQTRLLFTSYEALPIPFEQQQCTINLGALSSDDAKQLVTKVMNIKSQSLSFNVQSNAVRVLVDTVNCHARTLVSLANEIKTTEVINAGQNIRRTILKQERVCSIRKNKSFFSNIRKSIKKVSYADVKFIKSLAVFHSHVSIKILQKILGVDDKKIRKIIDEMVRAGLVEQIIEYDYLRFDPMLSIYMDFSITSKQKELYQNRLINLMDEKIKYLDDLSRNNFLKYENLIKMEMPNLLMLLNTLSERLKNNQCHVDFFTRYLINIELLMRDIGGYQHKHGEIVKLCNQALEGCKIWGTVTFNLEKIKVDSLLSSGQIEESLTKANALIKKCEAAGKYAYSDAEYDIALAYATMGRVYDVYGKTRDALPYLEKAQEKFAAMGKKGLFMAFSLLGEQADCWKNEGNFSKAEEVYKKIFENEKYESIPKSLLSISKYLRAINNIRRKKFDIAINDLNSAVVFFKAAKDINKTHQSLAGLGHAYREMALKTKGEAIYYMRKSEDYYMQALATYDSAKNPKHEAETFIELGNLYNAWNRQEYAAKFYQMAANIFLRLNDLREEGIARSNLAHALIQVGHYNQAYEELKRSLVCKEPYNSSVEPWITWNLLSYLEKVKGNMLAAKDNYQKALSMFLSYRRIGGEHPSKIDALCRFIFNELNQEDTSKAVEFINNLSMQNDWQEYQNFLEKLQAILAGERSLALAEDEDLRYDLAAELILLLEELQEAGI